MGENLSIDTSTNLTNTLARLPDGVRGGPVADIVGWLDALRDAGYVVEVFHVQGQRVYRATDPETGAREQVRTVAGAVTDWTAARGVAKLWGMAV